MSELLRAMSYNVRYANPNDEYGWEGRREAVANTIRFHRPDVVGLQEPRPSQFTFLDERLPAYEWLAAGRGADGQPGEFASVGFRRDRFDRRGDGAFWLSETPSEPGRGWDAALPRLLRYVHLRDAATGRTFVHVNTHFDHAGATARERSATLVRDRLPGITGDHPVVFTGDLNCRPDSEPYRRLTADGDVPLDDAHAVAHQPHHGPETSMTDFRNLVPGKKIDYVFVSPAATVHTHGCCANPAADGCYPSDHLPVVADLTLPDGAARE